MKEFLFLAMIVMLLWILCDKWKKKRDEVRIFLNKNTNDRYWYDSTIRSITKKPMYHVLRSLPSGNIVYVSDLDFINNFVCVYQWKKDNS